MFVIMKYINNIENYVINTEPLTYTLMSIYAIRFNKKEALTISDRLRETEKIKHYIKYLPQN
jgi:hypothetical protein